MKRLLLIPFVFLYLISNSQIKIGYKLNEIFKNPKKYTLFNSTTEETEGVIYTLSMYKIMILFMFFLVIVFHNLPFMYQITKGLMINLIEC